MNIAFDKDGTMTDLRYFPIGRGTKSNTKTILDTAPDLKYENNALIRKVLYYGMALYTRVCPYRKGLSELTKKLAEKGDKITIVTSTCMGTSDYIEGRKIRALVELSLIENDIVYHDIIFTKSNKVKESLENKFDLVVEDNPHNIISLREAGINTVRMITSQNDFIENDRHHAAKDILELEYIIERIRKEKELIKRKENKRLTLLR
ncbi:MAG TPA: hypothetical protein GX713_02175 [Mollicutes bacterium]|nr:hypothetical protein [Mollicutes bacterium]